MSIEMPVRYGGADNVAIWFIVSIVIAIMGGILVYFLFLGKENENKYEGKVKWLYDFLNFKKNLIEVLLKIGYIITLIYITLSSLALIANNFVLFIIYLVGGNVLARVMYELVLTLLIICRNTTEINEKLKTKTEPKAKEEKISSKKEDK